MAPPPPRRQSADPAAGPVTATGPERSAEPAPGRDGPSGSNQEAAHAALAPDGGLADRARRTDVVPPPMPVTWGTDPFVVTLARAPAGDRLSVTVRYTGAHPIDSPSGAAAEWTTGIMLGPRPLSAHVRRSASTFVELDLYGDSSTYLRVSDEASIVREGGRPGRRHSLWAGLSTAGGGGGWLTVHDPAATAAQVPARGILERDDPGSPPRSILVEGRTTEILLDVDGDQRKDHLVRIARADPLRRPADRRVRLSMVRAATGEVVLDAVAPLAAPATADQLFPVVTDVTDGHAPTRIDLLLGVGSQWLTIWPPAGEASATVRPAYTVDLAGTRFPVPASSTPRERVGVVTDAGATGGVLWNDVRLGAYDDRFRLTLRPRGDGTAVLAVSLLYLGEVMSSQAVEVTCPATAGFQVLRSGPVSVDVDLDGDRRPDVQLYDRLTSSTEHGGRPQRDRNHRVRLVGPAVAAEPTMSFWIRNGIPQRSESTRPLNRSGTVDAVAVGALREQARGAATFDAQLDQYETALMQVRRDAADAGTVRPGTYRAWALLSQHMIKIRPQTTGTVQPALQAAAAAAARDLFAALAAETRHTEFVRGGRAHLHASNRYTGEHRTTTLFTTSVTGAGPELAGHIESARWTQAFDAYQRLVSGLDTWIVDRLRATRGAHDPARMRAEFLTRSRERLAAIDRFRPTRVLAALQPDERFRSEHGYVDHVPLNLYYHRDGGSWYLTNLTNPERPHHYRVDAAAGDAAPPMSLFAELDDPDRLPAGVVVWEVPGVAAGQVTVTPRLTWREFLTYLGIGLAVVGLVLSAGTGSVAVAGAWALAGSGVAGGLAAAIDLVDRAGHGDLDATTAVVDIAQIVAAVAGGGMLAAGRAARAGFIAARGGTPLTGRAAAVAVAANRIYVVSAASRVTADVVTVAAITVQTARELDEIENGPGDRPGKDRAKALLLAQVAVTGGLTALSIRGELPALGDGRRLILRTPRGETVAHAFVEGAEATPTVRFSQKDIGRSTRGGTSTVEEVADEYRARGYTDEPIRVVELPDGTKVTLDNRRLWAARQAGLTDIPTEFHPPSEPFPATEAVEGFVLRYTIRQVGDELVAGGTAGRILHKKGAVPTTYGEAALFRTANQGNIAGGGGRFPLWGRTELPTVRAGKDTVRPAGDPGE